MRFLMIVCAGSSFEPPESPERLDAETRGWLAEAEQRGIRVLGGRIAPPGEATVLTNDDGKLLRRPGPRLNVDEQVIGFDVLDAATADEIFELVSRHPMTPHGSIELRQLLDE